MVPWVRVEFHNAHSYFKSFCLITCTIPFHIAFYNANLILVYYRLRHTCNRRPSAARSRSTGTCCGGMVSKTTTASKGEVCLSVYGLLYRTFGMSIFVPALWSRWPQSALQTPFALSNCSCCILHGLDTRGLRYDRATAVLVRCFVLPDCPTPRRELCWHQCCWLPIFGRRAFVLDGAC